MRGDLADGYVPVARENTHAKNRNTIAKAVALIKFNFNTLKNESFDIATNELPLNITASNLPTVVLPANQKPY